MGVLLPGGVAHGSRLMTLHELQAFGEALGRDAQTAVPCCITLEGDLGAGKTTLTSAIGRGFEVREPVTSPTFSLVHAYTCAGGREFFHLDLYRVKAASELANLGWDDLFTGHSIVVIEWPDRAAGLVPPDALQLRLQHVDGDETRRMVSW